MSFCTNCGTMIPDEAQFCTGCGNPVPGAESNAAHPDSVPMTAADNTIVTVYGYREAFAWNPAVKILVNGALAGEVNRCERTTIPINGPCTLTFKCSFRSAKCFVKGGESVVLSFNRFSGALGATISNGGQQLVATINAKREEDGNNWIKTAIFLAVLPIVLTAIGVVVAFVIAVASH